MPNPLDQFESPESILLMYLADELSAADRADVDRRLAADAQLRTSLESLQAMQREFGDSLARMDAGSPLKGERVAIRKFSAEFLRRQVAVPAKTPAEVEVATGRSYKGIFWAASSVAAAAALVVVMWMNTAKPTPPPVNGQVADASPSQNFQMPRQSLTEDESVSAQALADSTSRDFQNAVDQELTSLSGQ